MRQILRWKNVKIGAKCWNASSEDYDVYKLHAPNRHQDMNWLPTQGTQDMQISRKSYAKAADKINPFNLWLSVKPQQYMA